MDTALDPFDLDTRKGWPEDLRAFILRYPREVWPKHANLGEMAQFWLQIHEGFRATGTGLKEKTADFREGRLKPAEFRAWFGPRLRQLLSHLEGHHQIEDFSFFPLFTRIEPSLARGFETLESDHEAIHRSIDLAVADARLLLEAGPAEGDALRRAADAYAQSHEALLLRLDRHLLDEEDLIIPIILDRGEAKLGF